MVGTVKRLDCLRSILNDQMYCLTNICWSHEIKKDDHDVHVVQYFATIAGNDDVSFTAGDTEEFVVITDYPLTTIEFLWLLKTMMISLILGVNDITEDDDKCSCGCGNDGVSIKGDKQDFFQNCGRWWWSPNDFEKWSRKIMVAVFITVIILWRIGDGTVGLREYSD